MSKLWIPGPLLLSGESGLRVAGGPSAPPVAPSGLVATAVSDDGINLTWTDNADDETGFEIQRATEPTFAAPTTLLDAASPYSDTGLDPSTTYHYRVRALRDEDVSEWSNTDDATTHPAAPSALVATAVTDDRIDLTWTDNSADETGFEIHRDEDSGFGSPTSLLDAASPYSDTGLEPSTTYHYRVRAVRGADVSAWSNTDDAVTPAAPILPPLTGLLARYRADDLTGANGSAVSAWPNLANPGTYDASQGTGSAQPSLIHNARNGKKAVRFTRAGDFMNTALPADTKPCTFVAVVKPAVNDNSVHQLLGISGNGGIGFQMHNGAHRPKIHIPGIWAGASATTAINSGSYYWITASYGSAGEWAFYRNGTLDGSGTANHTPTAGRTHIIGRGSPGWDAEDLGADVCELFKYDHVLDATERAALSNYVADFYAL